MMNISFSKWSAGGNTTIFLPLSAGGQASPEMAKVLQSSEMLGAEQLGHVDLDRRRLRMSGGEFCLNAARSFGALLDLERPCRIRSYRIGVSGLERPLEVDVAGTCPDYHCAARLSLGAGHVTALGAGRHLVHLPGISHLLLPCPAGGLPDNHTEIAARLRKDFDLDGMAACGVIWWREKPGPRIWPLVHVRDTGTDYLENSCGSGSLALALALSGGRAASFEIAQPGGGSIACKIESGGDGLRAGIGGPVRLVASGTVWMPQADSHSGTSFSTQPHG